MATVPTPRSWGVSEAVTAAKFNTDIRDSFEFILRPPRARLTRTADMNIPSTVMAIPWDKEDYDTDNGHNNVTNNTRYTSQTAGWYYLNTSFWFYIGSSLALTGTREVCFQKNSSSSLKQNRQDEYLGAGDKSGRVFMRTAGFMYLAVNDYVEVVFHQDSGGTGIMNRGATGHFAFFSIRWVRA